MARPQAYICCMASYRSRSRLMPLVVLPPLFSGTALAVALASQFWGGLQPCVLCLYQRWPHAAALVLGMIAVLLVRSGHTRPARFLTYLAGLALLVTAGIGAFHMGVEWRWWEGTASCGSTLGAGASVDDLRAALLATPVVRCDAVAWSFLGISMAGYNFILSGLLGIIVLIRTAHSKA
ncbi:MAG: disulfide bond formation protein B [Elstera sp.]